MKKLSVSIVLAALTLGSASNAMACGESLFHAGQGMRYHAFITRQPAQILFFTREAEESSAQHQLYSGLQRAGHKVTVVSDRDRLAQELGARHYDVIIAGADDMADISRQLDNAKPAPSLVAIVADQGAGNLPAQHALRRDDGLNQYLKVIEQSMQARRS